MRQASFFSSASWALALTLAVGSATAADGARQRTRIDDGWRFALGHASEPAQDFDHGIRMFFFGKAGYGDGPAAADFEDRPWRRVDLPHDWAVELPFSSHGSSQHGKKAIGRGFPENSVGWYRRELAIPQSARGQRIALEFDGVFRDSVVWVNGHYLRREASGYSGFQVDTSDYLNFGGRNVVAVRVDATTQEGWWYEGAGIYRHVWLTQTGPLHVAPHGNFVRATVVGDRAEVAVDTTVRNGGNAAESFSLAHELRDPAGRVVARASVPAGRVAADASLDVTAQLSVEAPQLWSMETPQRYTLTTVVKRGAEVVDRVDTPFGIRTIRFDANQGFFLNGRHVKLHGVNNHQDHAGVGVALPDGMHEARLKMLKAMGVNAIRSAHNPATPELLEACDRLGMLVIDEHRMMGTAPQIRDELERTRIRADGDDVAVVRVSVVDREGRVVPTANQRISFEVSGPARLIGMGNGDPGSHEADKPAEFHRYAAVSGWRQKAVAKPEDATALLGGTGSAGWRDPFAWLPPEKQPADGAWNVVHASFARPAAAGRAALFIGDITPGQQAYLNGKAVTPRREDGMGVIDIDAAQLSDVNTLTLVFATPAGGTRKLFDDAQGGRRWLTLRTTTAAAPWQRSVFNGHAQVILQSTGSAGRATLRATSDGLDLGTLNLDTF